MAEVRAKKALGQHFLTDQSVAQRIAATLDEYVGMPVLEIGPGMGVLTQYLLERGHDLYVVEIDHESVEYLHKHFPALNEPGYRDADKTQPLDRIIEGDFLRMDLADLFDGRQLCVIGNYPYNISSQIFFKVLEYKDLVPCCSGMLQREVAERLCAPAGIKARGILSVLLQAWYQVDYLFTVSEHVFNPPPKVKSGVIKMVRNDVEQLPCEPRLFKTVVKTTFGQRRKTLRNSIKPLMPPGVPLPDDPLLALRPEQLTNEQFYQLTLLVSQERAATSEE